jgi:protein-glucosylgalactosylhydroxylysine glucosidase
MLKLKIFSNWLAFFFLCHSVISESIRPSPRAHSRSLLVTVSDDGCKNLTATNLLDFQATTRSKFFPNGLAANLSTCSDICCNTSDCVLYAWLNGGDGTASDTCWPLQSGTGLISNSNVNHFIGIPPQPQPPPPQPTPSSWIPRILSGDMLYSSVDYNVSADLHPMIGNGFVATQMMSDAIYCSGIYNGDTGSSGSVSHRARIPAVHAIPAPGTPGPSALDIRTATYYRRSFLNPSTPGSCTTSSNISCTNSADQVWIEQRWYAHRALPSVMVMEVQLLFNDSITSNSEFLSQTQLSTTAATPFAMILLDNDSGGPSNEINFQPVSVSPDSGYTIIAGQTYVKETVNASLFNVAVLATSLPSNNVVQFSALGETQAFIAVIRTSIETQGEYPSSLISAVESDYSLAEELMSNGTLWSTHVAEWEATIWGSGFETDRIDVARAVNSSLYAIVSSMRADRPFSTSPGGLAKDCYNSHSFWDCETWMYPGILMTNPDIANMMLQYRLVRLPGAEYKAQSYNPPYSGAMYAWESAVTGVELAPSPWGVYEDHISSDIALAIMQFWKMKRDNSDNWLNDTAWPILKGITRFWMSKLVLDNANVPADSPLSIKNVMGPDEYHFPVDNSAFTNAGVIISLRAAIFVAQMLGDFAGISPAELDTWIDAESRVVMPFDTSKQYHPEYASYTYGTQVKQADTVLLGFPLEIDFNMTPAIRANDLNAYGGKNTDINGPAMTWGAFAIGYIELGEGFEQNASSNFNRSFSNVRPPFDVWTETPTGGCPNFLTGAGGFLQTAFNGYSGLRINMSSATFHNPRQPEGATTTTLRGIAYLGNRITIVINQQTISVTVLTTPSSEVVDAMVSNPLWKIKYQMNKHKKINKKSGEKLLPLSQRSQIGRVLLNSTLNVSSVIPAKSLAVKDSNGMTTPLVVGEPLVLSLQTISIVAID